MANRKNKQKATLRGRFAALTARVKKNRMGRGMLRHFEWRLFLIVMALSVYGVISIFAATGVPVDNPESYTMLEMLSIQPITYARLQVIWILAGMVAMGVIIYFDYQIYGDLRNLIYWLNVGMLLLVKLGTEAGRGNANMFFKWGEGRTFQPAEFGKIAIIIALAKLFAERSKPITTVGDLMRVSFYVGLPLGLVVIQPDVGTALVYVVIYAGLLLAADTDWKIIIGILAVAILIAVPVWYSLETMDSFRVDRIQVWLHPDYDPTGAGMQTTNARIALGSGGIFGKGMFSEGNFAALNYIPDDHTDFIFAIVGETFGLVGAGLMVLMFLALLLRMMRLSTQAQDRFGSFLIIGVASMMLAHIFENIAMVIGLMPVTGIPLPFVSYGGSNYVTNIIGVGLVINVAMRSRVGQARRPRSVLRPAKL